MSNRTISKINLGKYINAYPDLYLYINATNILVMGLSINVIKLNIPTPIITIHINKVIRVATRKNVSKKIQDSIEASDIYEYIKSIYNNKIIESKILEFIGKVISSNFEIIEYDTDKHMAGDIDKQPLPIINDIVIEELLMFITQI